MLNPACAGAPVAVANLWDVTDRDIDRFARAVLAAWLPAPAPGGAPAAPAPGAPLERRLHDDEDGGEDAGGGRGWAEVAAAVAAARGACRLPHLIGAAPVCYGLPCAVGC